MNGEPVIRFARRERPDAKLGPVFAESIDKTRESWWLGLRDVEKEKSESEGRNFEEDAPIWYADLALFAGMNELDAPSLVLETEGLPAIVLTLLAASSWRQNKSTKLIVEHSVARNLTVIIDIHSPA